MALVGRLLEAQGFRVGIISQPDWHSAEDFKRLGKPNLFFGVTAGNMDSMVNRYTADRKIRSSDAYTPDGAPDKRPDHAVTVYCAALPRSLSRCAAGHRQHRGEPAPHRALRLLVGQRAPLDPARRQGRPAAVRQRRARAGRTRAPPGRGRKRSRPFAICAAPPSWCRAAGGRKAGPKPIRPRSIRRGAIHARPDPYAMSAAPAPATAAAATATHAIRFHGREERLAARRQDARPDGDPPAFVRAGQESTRCSTPTPRAPSTSNRIPAMRARWCRGTATATSGSIRRRSR